MKVKIKTKTTTTLTLNEKEAMALETLLGHLSIKDTIELGLSAVQSKTISKMYDKLDFI